MTEGFNEKVPPNLPPPPPPFSFPTPPPPWMPPPVPGTGAGSRSLYQAPAPLPSVNTGFYSAAAKSVGVAYLLWFFLGWFGVHHFYLGKVGRGIGYLLTFAWFTIGWWVDLFTLPAQVKRVNAERRAGLR